ncbi:MAG TPA: endonuclease [Flavobacteriales bacterium]|nr:endonuclease [Flavobacteriales bacterium]
MRSFPLLVLLGLPVLSVAQPPAGYYDSAQGLTGESLRQALHDIIDGHTVLANSQLWAAYGAADRKANNRVWDIYSDVPDGAPPYEYEFGVDQCGNYAAEGDCFNREHSFPQSWFGGVPGPDTDVFHMYPTDAWVNQKRANWPYGTVGGGITFQAQNGGRLGQCNYPGCSGLVFEPINAYKGDLARSYFYMLTRYKDEAVSWSSAPVLSGGEFLPWVENLLMDWHLADPVSAKEIARNNVIFTNLQHNRNPYIDHPEWVQRIWGPTASVENAEQPSARIWWDGDVVRIDRGNNTAPASVQVHDVTGALVQRTSLSGATGALELAHVPGIYFVVLEDGRRQVSRIIR